MQTVTHYLDGRQLTLIGEWHYDSEAISHNHQTDLLHDRIEFAIQEKDLAIVAASRTGKQIAVVITLNDQPIPSDIAGSDLKYGEGQSYFLIDQKRSYHLLRSSEAVNGTITLTTRSDKLVIYSFDIM